MAHYLNLDLKRPSQPPSIFSSPVSGLPSSVEAQISATHASTSVVFILGPQYCTLTVALHWPHMLHVNLCEIFEYTHLKFTVSGRSKQARKQASIDIHVRNAVTLVWGSLRLAPITIFALSKSVKISGYAEADKLGN